MNLQAFSNYSILFGYLKPEEIVQEYYNMGYSYAVITDIYNISGLDYFILECRKLKIKPVVGITVKLKYKEYSGYASFLFRNKNGYLSFIETYNRYIIESKNNKYLFEHDSFINIRDIIVIIGNKDSILSNILHQKENLAFEFISKMNSIYTDRIYFSYSEIRNQQELSLKKYLYKHKYTNIIFSSPFIHQKNNKKDGLYKHITLIAIDYKTKFEEIMTHNKNNIEYYDQNYFLNTKESIENKSLLTKKTVELCEFNYTFAEIIDKKEFVYSFKDAKSIVQKVAKQKLEKILEKQNCHIIRSKYMQRYEQEINMYDKIDIYNILYIVYDFIKWSKNNKIHIGPGRGSCVGSLLVYLLDITSVDPIQHSLLFERFINEDRYTIADIDIDVANSDRNKLINYIVEKYSNNTNNEIKVISIIVFLRFMEKSSFKDVMRATNTSLNFRETNNLMKESDKIFDNTKTIFQKLEQISHIYTKEKNKIKKLLESIIQDNISSFITETNNELNNKETNIEEKIDISVYTVYSYIIESVKIIESTIYFNESIKQTIEKIPKITIQSLLENFDKKTLVQNLTNLQNYIINKLNNLNEVILNSQKFKNAIRGTGIHAGGILITNIPYNKYFPVHISEDSNKIVIATQFDLEMVNNNNIFKFDILGLETIVLIQTVLKIVYETIKHQKDPYQIVQEKEHHRIIIDKGEIDINKTLQEVIVNKNKYCMVYRLIRQGFHKNIFQLDRPATASIANKMLFDRFDDIVAITSIIRPGASELVENYINNKRNFKQWINENSNEPDFQIVKNTFGILAFQEQITQIAIDIAGFEPKKADIFRYAIGKKKIEFVQKYKKEFFQGCSNNNIPAHKIEDLYNRIEKFAGYAFNKSHAVAYSYITLQTMYLKTFYTFIFCLTAINLKIKEKSKTRETCIELVMLQDNVFFIYPEIHQKHTEFQYEKINNSNYIFVSLLSIGGITESFTKKVKDIKEYNIQTIEKSLQEIKPNNKILNNMFNLKVFRRYKQDIKALEEKIKVQKKKDSKLKLDILFDQFIQDSEYQKNLKTEYNSLFRKQEIQNLIDKEYEFYENSYLKLNIASLIKNFIKKHNYFYIVSNKTKYSVTVVNMNLPFISYHIRSKSQDEYKICDVIIKTNQEDKKYFNITSMIVENNVIELPIHILEEYFHTEAMIYNNMYNIRDRFWYEFLYKIDRIIDKSF